MTPKATRQQVRQVRPLPKGRRLDVRREEFNRLIDMLNERGDVLNTVLRNQEIQFQRIAQMQAELDVIRKKMGL